MPPLVVAATRAELAPLLARMEPRGERGSGVSVHALNGRTIHVLVTGVGMVATAARVSAVLAGGGCELAVNAGVCGSFDPSLPPGTIVHVTSDRLAELGAEDGDRFLELAALGLTGDDDIAANGDTLINDAPPALPALDQLPRVRGITVNTVHGHEPSIAVVRDRCAPQVESMEGAAFMYACRLHGVPFAQVRAVSNVVERRNRDAWQLQTAITRLAEVVAGILSIERP